MAPTKFIEIADGIRAPLLDYATQGNAILGIRDSGKTYTATGIAEKLIEGGIPFVAFDPIGVWRFMRVKGEGRNATAFPVVVAGDNADLPLHPETAADLVRAAMREGVSLVIDLYSMQLSKADWRRIVETSIRVLLYENREFGPRHIILEEAAEFCPQVIEPEHRKVYSEIEKLARMGGNAGLGFTLANQRAEQVNKAVLELCEGVFLHRQRGRLSITAIKKWLELVMDRDEAADVASSLPNLERGECWVWMPGLPKPLRRKMPQKRSLHPDRRHRQSEGDGQVRVATNVAPFVTRMNVQLAELAAKTTAAKHGGAKAAPASGQAASSGAEAAALRAQVAELQQQLTVVKTPPAVEVPVLTPEHLSQLNTGLDQISKAVETLGKIGLAISGAIAGAGKPPTRLAPPRAGLTGGAAAGPLKTAGKTAPVKPAVAAGSHAAETTPMRAGIRRMMTVLAQRPGLTVRQIGVRAGLSAKSGTFRTYMGTMRSQGWVTEDGEAMSLTQEGYAALGSYTPLPQGRELLAYWKENMLRRGEARMLDVVADRYPATITDEELGQLAEIAHTSGTFRTYLGKLRSLDLLEGKNSAIRLSAELFE